MPPQPHLSLSEQTTEHRRATAHERVRPAVCVDDSVYLLERLRVLHHTLDEILSAPPASWTTEELASLSWLVRMFEVRLFTQAPGEVQQAYLDHLASIQRQGT